MKSSLIIKINARIVIVVGLCVLLLGVVEFFQTKSQIEKNLDTTLSKTSQRLGNSLVMPVWNIDMEVVDGIVGTEMADKNILAVAVKDSLSDQFILTKTRDEEWNIINSSELKGLVSSRKTTVPIFFKGSDLGSVTVYVTDLFLVDQLVASIARLVARMGILLILVVVVLGVFINLIVARPLGNLSSVCKKVAHGEFDLEIDVSGNDEIGSLARSFTHMRDAVKEKINSLSTEIRERRRSEAELLKLRSYLSNIIDSMPSILVGVDKNCHVTQWNLEAERVTGVAREDAYTKLLSLVLPCMADDIVRIEESTRDRKALKDSRVTLEINGQKRISDITIYPLVSNGAEGAVIRLDDVAERVRLEEVMVQTEKMMSVGGLAAGMAHEINNPLAGMMQSVQVIQNRFSQDLQKNHDVALECGISLMALDNYLRRRDILNMLSSIIESGERAARIIDNMLSFSRKSASRFIPCDLKDLLDRTVELASNDYDLKKKYDFRKIDIIREYSEDVEDIRCDSTTIQQVFLNILKNAAQALSPSMVSADGGAQVFASPRITLRIYDGEGVVKVDIEDNGVGMDEFTQKRIFEPFFTTKNIGVGTGLGLSVSFFIVKENHNGSIEVVSTPGQGSTFTVTLPV